jgi:hypothetical protein
MTKYLLLAVLVSACSAAIDEDPIDEAPLTAEEAALLPDGADDHEHPAALLEIAAAADDGASFDDDDLAPFADVEVRDDLPGVTAPHHHAALLAWGLHPRASDALRASGVAAWRITQTIGNAPASAGYHAQDGSVDGRPYCAATDLSVSGLSSAQIHNLLERLAKAGFAAWYRKDGADGWRGANHLHVVYANAKMKAQLRAQVRSFLVGRNGLVSNTIYQWHDFSAAAVSAVKAKFTASASGTSNGGSGVPARVNTSGAPLTVRSGASAGSAAVGSVADGAFITIRCQQRGQSVTGTYGTSTLWDFIGTGYVADAYVATGSDGQVAPTCP